MPLWPHQKEALAMLRSYLGGDPESGAALVSMPTGTGKSAVIAQLAASEEIAQTGLSLLVITPWRGLAHQLRHDIDTRVWQRLGATRPTSLPPARPVRSAAVFVAALRNEASEPAIYVSTFAMMLEIFNTLDNDTVEMARVFQRVAAVVVDECHYEPAPSWSEAVRATRRPVCLFTATPFRNDNRMFKLHAEARFRFSHDKAVADAFLREPEFERVVPDLSPPDFVTRVLEVAEQRLAAGERVIVRCDSYEEVETIAHELVGRGKRVLAVHERFTKRKDEYLHQAVPTPANMPQVDYYVHQNKLTEGFDDPAVRMLAIRDDFGNDRARVQQIGRVLRNPTLKLGDVAIVLTGSSQIERAWLRYRRFDSQEKAISAATDPMGVAKLLGAQPELFYWDRLFRERARVEDPQVWRHLKFRLSAVVRQPRLGFDLEVFVDRVSHDLEASNVKILNAERPDANVAVLLHVAIRNSPVLLEAAFVEVFLGYTVVHWDGTYLFMSSTESLPGCLRDQTAPLPAGRLAGLLPAEATISTVSLANNDLNEWAIRTRSLSARDLGLVASELGDSTYGYASASGSMRVDGDQVTRYTGARNGRVSDTRSTRGTFDDLLAWYNELSTSLSKNSKPAYSLARYGAPEPTPRDPVAAHVLLDIDPTAFVADDGSQRTPLLDRRGGPVISGRFSIEFDESEVEVAVHWDGQFKRFELTPSVEAAYRSAADPKIGLWRAVNRDQSFRIATEDGLVYSNHNFWKLDLRSAGKPDGLMSLLEPLEQLELVTEEKGHTIGQEMWPEDTVFGVLDRLFQPGSAYEMDAVLCTDLGREIADFIALRDRKVVFAHAKSKKESDASQISASALHEVVAQAMKSLRYMTIGNQEKPRVNAWNNAWQIRRNGQVVKGPASRLRRGDLGRTAAEYWKAIDAVIQSHASDREAWLVLGASLSKSALQNELGKRNPRAEALQVHALLTGAWSAAQQCGVRLRVFCSR